MNTNDEILVELRKISAWADRQRKISKRALIFVAVFVPAMILVPFVMEHMAQKSIEKIGTTEKHVWCDVDANIRRCDLAKAIQIGEELIQKTPQYPKGHEHLAAAYLAAGWIEMAKKHYAEAARLFPSEEYEKNLIAINKRLATATP